MMYDRARYGIGLRDRTLTFGNVIVDARSSARACKGSVHQGPLSPLIPAVPSVTMDCRYALPAVRLTAQERRVTR